MAQLPFAFNPAAVAPSQALDVLPSGWYPAKGIIESELKTTSSGGQAIAVTVELQNGRKVWTNFNIVNNSQKAVEIAYADLAALCAAIGLQQAVSDTQQLHGRPFDVKLKIQTDEGYDPRNVVAGGGFAPIGSKADKYADKTQMQAPAFAAAPAFQPQAPQQPFAGLQVQQPFGGQQSQPFQPPAPIQQPMPQPQQAAVQAPFGGAPAQAFAQQWNPNAAQQPIAQAPQQAQFQPHPGAPAWAQPR